MDKKRLLIGLVCMILSISIWMGCSKKEEQIQESIEVGMEQESEAEENPEIEDTEDKIPEGMERNLLTGLWIDEEAARRRPVAIMINNLHKALPQSGLSQADIFYETLAEGEITRILAVFQDFDAEKIGPVRSARHYFLDFAFDVDAVYLHYGGSPQAFEAVQKLKADNLNGLSYLDEILCWRDPVRRQQKGMLEHSVYTNAERIMKAWDLVGYRKEREEDLAPLFLFSDGEVLPQGEAADTVSVPFSKYQVSSFSYDTETKLYQRFQTGQAHIDENNHQQLAVKNIIVQYTDIHVIKGDTAGRREVKLVGSGEGIYITNGRSIPITWTKKDHKSPTQWKDREGNTLILNQGKTWICVFPENGRVELKSSKLEE